MIRVDLAHRAEQLIADGEPFVHATVVRAVQPTSVRAGDTAIVRSDGDIDGFVGGMCARASVALYAIRALETGQALLLRLEPGDSPPQRQPDPDGVIVAHNPCLSGGSLEIFLDPQLPAARIVIAGDMPIARALEEIARAAGYDAVRVDAADVQPRDTDAAMIVASHGNGEEIALTRALEAGVGYVGLVASQVRGRAVLESLGVADPARALVHTPAGLDIGARAPAEIAIAILAEFVQQRRAAAAGSDEPERGLGLGVSLPVVVPAVAIDPICGMEVVASVASIHLDLGGERVYFCREGCRATYLQQHAGHVTGS